MPISSYGLADIAAGKVAMAFPDFDEGTDLGDALWTQVHTIADALVGTGLDTATLKRAAIDLAFGTARRLMREEF